MLATLIYNSVESLCRPWCRALLPTGISSYLVLACSVVRLRCSVWYLVRGIVLYPLVSSCRLQSVVLPRYSCRSSIVVGRACCCSLSLVLSSCGTSCSRSPCLLAALVGRLVVPVACGCLIVPGVATAWPPVGTLRRPDWRPSGGGGRFFKEGGEANRNPTRPLFHARGQKKCGFSAQKRGKRGEFEEKEKRVRKRK